MAVSYHWKIFLGCLGRAVALRISIEDYYRVEGRCLSLKFDLVE